MRYPSISLKSIHQQVRDTGMISQIKKHPRLAARMTEVNTAHGSFATPAFMPVGTRAAVNCMTVHELQEAGSSIILGGNTYHMLVSPGMNFIQHAGGMHRMMAWPGPMLTDSGGYQVFSLSRDSKICKIDEVGAKFKHPETGNIISLSPQESIATQKIIGADIIMAFDQCTPEEGGYAAAQQAMVRTHRWLLESIDAHQHNVNSAYGYQQYLFGIIQGGSFRDLREQSAEFVMNSGVDGLAIGGESIGYRMDKTVEILDWVLPYLPEHKTRYTMGVGMHPQDLIDVVAKGVDIFDCVAPTRNARHGALLCGRPIIKNDWVVFEEGADRGRILIKKAEYARDHGPISEGCNCYTCQHHTRSYLHFLFKTKSLLYAPLACIHNIGMMHQTCEVMRGVIAHHAVQQSH